VPDRFSKSNIWDNYDTDEQIYSKASLIRQLIPPEVNKILDVGCGNGIITNLLSDRWDITGIDTSETALTFLTCPAVLASAMEIPFADISFDLVLSSEMLEHLNNGDLAKAITELKRTAGKYLVISVPNGENLRASYASCPQCGTVFHAWHHLQSFTPERMLNLFEPEFRILKRIVTGPSIQNWIPQLLDIRQKHCQWLFPGDKSICPYCGNTEFQKPHSSFLTKAINGLNRILCSRKQYWQVCLYQRKHNI
jgi:SAM-dependent methyltransferase